MHRQADLCVVAGLQTILDAKNTVTESVDGHAEPIQDGAVAVLVERSWSSTQKLPLESC